MTLPISIRGTTETIDAKTGARVLAVADPNALTQVLGWLKFRAPSGMVVVRGQSSVYAEMLATGFRPPPSQAGKATVGPRAHASLANALRQYIDLVTGGPCQCQSGPYTFGQGHRCDERVVRTGPSGLPLLQGTYRAVAEPLLQHYGLRTRWLDVVDNVWVALWFACHKEIAVKQHAFHLKRSVAQEGTGATAYIAVLETGQLSATSIPGYSVGHLTRLVDLRYSVPSVYLRPHAQHGLLLAPTTLQSGSESLKPQVSAYIEIKLSDALDWLGNGAMTSSHVIFPPAALDEGYRRLLDTSVAIPDTLGGVTRYGPGY